MSRQSARDIRYGRRGGGWVDEPRPAPTTEPKRNRTAVVLDPARLFHPDTIATARAHQRRRPGSCASDNTGPATEPADDGAVPDPVSLFDPATPVTAEAHESHRPGSPASDATTRPVCDCQPDPGDLAALWAGRARMAAARKAAGVQLDAIDTEAPQRESRR